MTPFSHEGTTPLFVTEHNLEEVIELQFEISSEAIFYILLNNKGEILKRGLEAPGMLMPALNKLLSSLKPGQYTLRLNTLLKNTVIRFSLGVQSDSGNQGKRI